MAVNKCMLLLAAVIFVSMLSVQGGQHNKRVSYAYLLSVFSDVASPYEEKKTFRNLETDTQVNSIMEQIEALVPELLAVHKVIHNISAGLPLLKTNIGQPLLQVKTKLKKVVLKLARCEHTVSPLTARVTDATGSTRVTGSSTPVPQFQDSGEEDEVEYTNETPEEIESQILNDLLPPVHVHSDDSEFDALLGSLDEHSVVGLRDAVEVFKTMADKIASAHKLRFLDLVPKIKKVKENINSIVEHVSKAKNDVIHIHEHASSFYKSSLVCINNLIGLTENILTTARNIC